MVSCSGVAASWSKKDCRWRVDVRGIVPEADKVNEMAEGFVSKIGTNRSKSKAIESGDAMSV